MESANLNTTIPTGIGVLDHINRSCQAFFYARYSTRRYFSTEADLPVSMK
jgi:hypothetical protein